MTGRSALRYLASCIWLLGIGLIGERPPFLGNNRLRWNAAYFGLTIFFVAAHASHAALVFSRLS